MSELDRLASELARISKRLDAVESAPRLGHSSFEGVIREYDPNDDERVVMRIGLQHDGTHVAAPITGPPPPVPTDAIVEGRPGGIFVAWDGAFLEDAAVPMDFGRIEVHVSIAPGFTPSRLTLAHVFDSPQGGETFLARDDLTYYVRLVARSLAGVGSEPSGEVEVAALPSADVEQITEEVLSRIPPSGNIVPDPKFRDPAITAAREADGQRLRFESDPAISRDGNAYAVFDHDLPGAVPNRAWMFFTDGTDYTPIPGAGRDYQVSFWTRRSPDAQGDVKMQIAALVDGDPVWSENLIEFVMQDDVPTDGWKHWTATYTPPAGATAVSVYLAAGATTGFYSGQMYVSGPTVVSEAVVDAILAQMPSGAGDGTTITYATAEPFQDGNKAGDTWFHIDEGLVVGQWRWNGADWTPMLLDGAMFANIDAGTITVGELNAALIKAGTLTVDKLNVGIGGNLYPDPKFLSAESRAARLTDTQSRLFEFGNSPGVAMGGVGWYVRLSYDLGESGPPLFFGILDPSARADIPVTEGERYTVSVWASTSDDYEATTEFFRGLNLTMLERNGAGLIGRNFQVAQVERLGNKNWQRYEWTYQVPPGVVSVQPGFESRGQTAGSVYLTDIFMNRKAPDTEVITQGSRTNLVVNPSFEQDSGGWIIGYFSPSVREDGTAAAGNKYARFTVNNPANPGVRHTRMLESTRPYVDSETEYTFSAYVRVGRRQRMRITLRYATESSSGGGWLSGQRFEAEQVIDPTDGWVRMYVTGRSAGGSARQIAEGQISAGEGEEATPWEAGDYFDLDGVLLEKGGLQPYFDGETPGPPLTGWSGEPGYSISHLWLPDRTGAPSVLAADGRYATRRAQSFDATRWINLNYITSPGVYHQDLDGKASFGLNYPTDAYGGLLEVTASADGEFIYQTYTARGTGAGTPARRWMRSFHAASSAWTDWTPLAIAGGTVPQEVRVDTVGVYGWTKPAGLAYVKVRCQGGGGGGGSAASTGSGRYSAGNPGGGGWYAESIIAASDLPHYVVLTVGAGGAGGVGEYPNGDGQDGEPSSFGAFVVGGGGAFGASRPAYASNSTPPPLGGNGSYADSKGDIIIPPTPKQYLVISPDATTCRAAPGGSAALGAGAVNTSGNSTGNSATVASHGYGGGGAPGNNNQNQGVSRPGGDGAQGIVIIEHYYN